MAKSEAVNAIDRLTPNEKTSLERLLKKVIEGDTALFIGAGASLRSEAPTGKDLADLIKEEFNDVDFEDAGNNLLDICQEIENTGQGVKLSKFVEKIFYGLSPTDSHLALPKYPFAVMYTTNYDDLIEKAFDEYYRGGDKDSARICKTILNIEIPYFLQKKDEAILFKLMGNAKRDDPNESMV